MWRILPASALPELLAGHWRELNENYLRGNPLLDARFVEPLVRHFGSADLVLARDERDGKVVGAAILERRGTGNWQVFMPSQAPLSVILTAPPLAGEVHPLQGLISALPGFAWLIGVRNYDPGFPGVAWDDGRHIERIPLAATISVTVDRSFEDYWKGRDQKLRENTRRAFRKLERSGIKCELRPIVDAAAIAGAVAVHGDIESAGWKGKQGTAIHADNVQGRFYTDMLSRFAANGDARLYQLWFNDRVAASQLAVRCGAIMVLLKTTFDETQAALGPGRLMQYLLLERLFAEPSLRTIEFYTKATVTDSSWATASRDMFHLNYYRTRWMRKLKTALRSNAGARIVDPPAGTKSPTGEE